MERLLGNKTEKQTVLFVVRGTRTLSAARQTIENAAESEIGPKFKAFLKQLSQEEATISLGGLRQGLAL